MSHLPPLNRQFFENTGFAQNESLPYPDYRYTKYFWLINLQQTVYTKDQAAALCKLLQKAVLEVFTQGDVVAFAHPNHRWDRRFIGENELKIAIEIGPKTGKVHCHLIQEIKHRSVINIDPGDVKKAIDSVLAIYTGGRIKSVFVSRKLHPSSKPLEEYIDKDNERWRDNPVSVQGIWSYSLKASPGETVWSVERKRRELAEPVSLPMVLPVVKKPKIKVPPPGPSVKLIPTAPPRRVGPSVARAPPGASKRAAK